MVRLFINNACVWGVKLDHWHAELNDATIPHMLSLIFPKLEGQLMLAKNVQRVEALEEIKVHEEDTSFLSPQCQYILGITVK